MWAWRSFALCLLACLAFSSWWKGREMVSQDFLHALLVIIESLSSLCLRWPYQEYRSCKSEKLLHQAPLTIPLLSSRPSSFSPTPHQSLKLSINIRPPDQRYLPSNLLHITQIHCRKRHLWPTELSSKLSKHLAPRTDDHRMAIRLPPFVVVSCLCGCYDWKPRG